MRQRLTFVLGAITALALVTGAAWAAIPTSVESVIDVADAGTVTVAVGGAALEVTAVDPAAGWDHEVEVASGREVEVDFRNGVRRIQFNAELEDGQVRVRLRERAQAGGSPIDDSTSTTVDDSTSTTMDDDTTSTTVDDTTSTTVDDTTSTTVDDSTSTTMDDDTTSTTVDDSTSTTVDDSTSTTMDDHTTSTTVDDTTSVTVDDDDGSVGSGTETYSVSGVANVTITWTDGGMSLVSITLADGWQVEKQELRSDRIKLEFEAADDRDARFEADFHDGSIRVETRVD